MKIKREKSMKINFPINLTAEQSERYNLSIRIGDGGLAFAGYISGDVHTFFYETASLDADISYIDALKNIFFENECMKYVYKSLNVIYVTEKYTIVPDDVYIEKSKDELFSFCVIPTEKCKIMSQRIENQNFVILYELDSEAYEFLVRSFVNVNFAHALSPLLTVWQQSSLEAYPKHVYVNVRQGIVDIVGFEQGNLLFANSFPYEKENDLLYFVMYVSKQLGINQLEDELFFCGETSVCLSVIKVLKTYFEHITLLSTKNETLAMSVQRAPFDVIKLMECGL